MGKNQGEIEFKKSDRRSMVIKGMKNEGSELSSFGTDSLDVKKSQEIIRTPKFIKVKTHSII